jgi:hypothetical protein
VGQGFPEDILSPCLSVGAFAAFAIGIVGAGSAATDYIGEETQTDGDHQDQDEQPYVFVADHKFMDGSPHCRTKV